MNENGPASTCDTVSITEAARRLDCSVRTVQRRLDSGALESVEVDGQRRVQLPRDNATPNATSDATSGTRHDTTTRQNDAPQHDSENELQGDTTRHDTRQMARHGATDNATPATTNATADTRVIEILERENSFLKSQIESANRATAEAHAALRAALAAQPRALNEGSPQVLAVDENARETMPQVLVGASQNAPERADGPQNTTAIKKTAAKPSGPQIGSTARDGRGFRQWLLKVLRG